MIGTFAGELALEKMKNIYIVAINSDPTCYDTDDDFDPDGVDPAPMHRSLNGYFISNVALLEQAAIEFDYNVDDLGYKYNDHVENWLVIVFIRHFNSDYVGGNWSVVGGDIQSDFVCYVHDNYPELYDYFNENEYIYADYEGNVVALRHMSAMLSAYMYETDLLDGAYLTDENHNLFQNNIDNMKAEMPEYYLNELSGWAGDLQTDMVDAYNSNSSNDYEDFKQEMENTIGDPNRSFGMNDVFADTDAHDVYYLIEKGDAESVSEALTLFYEEKYTMRFKIFINSISFLKNNQTLLEMLFLFFRSIKNLTRK